MKPEYANYFIVRKNETNTEVIIDFNHTYNSVEVEEGEKMGTLDILSTVKSTKVGSIVTNIEDARAFRDLLDKVINEASK